MANISKPLNQGFAAPNIVANYGPYSSVTAAHTALSEDRLNVVGMTVGITDSQTNTIVEYWYQGGTNEVNLVPKGGHVDTDSDVTQGSENPVEGGAVFSELSNMGDDIGTVIKVGVEVWDTHASECTAPANYPAGTIFYINEGNDGDATSQFVDGLHFYVALADGSEDDSFEDNSLFYDAGNSAVDAVKMRADVMISLNDCGNVDTQNSIYVVEKDGVEYFVPLTPLKPAMPSIQNTGAVVVTGNAEFTVSNGNNAAEVQVYYKIDDGASWILLSGEKISIPSGFSNNADNTQQTHTVYLKATLNGHDSDVNTVPVTIDPKVAKPGVTVNRADGDYSDSANVVFTPSASVGSTSVYSTDGGSTWTPFSQVTTITVTDAGTYPDNKYQAKASKSGYQNSEVAKYGAFVIGKYRMYWDVLTSVPADDATIRAMSHNIKADSFPRSITLPSSGVQAKNLVFAYNKATVGNVDVTTLNIGGFDYQFNISTVGSFRVCVCANLAASAAGLTAVFS